MSVYRTALPKLAIAIAMIITSLTAGPNIVRAQSGDIVDTAVSAGSFDTLVAAVKAAGLVDTLKGSGPLTVFAPTDDAFQQLPEGTLESLLKPENKDQLVAILTYHVVPGRVTARDAYSVDAANSVNGQRLAIARDKGRLLVEGANVVTTDIKCTNGMIHVIDRVLLPAQETLPVLADRTGQFTTLLAAVEAAGLAETLGSEGPFTVFAPTDDAFAKLPAGTVETLLRAENRTRLVNILKYHVLAGRIYASDAIDAGEAKTLAGRSVRASVTGEGVQINDATVVELDIDAANGVVHVIDRVLIPEEMSPGQAMDLLRATINRGVPMFNHGHVHGCADLYTDACREIVDAAGDEMPRGVTSALSRSLERAQHMHSATDRAWTLRHGMDMAMLGLRTMMATAQ